MMPEEKCSHCGSIHEHITDLKSQTMTDQTDKILKWSSSEKSTAICSPTNGPVETNPSKLYF